MLVIKIILGLFIYWLIPTIIEKINDFHFDYKMWLRKRTDKKTKLTKASSVNKEWKKRIKKQKQFVKKHPILSLIKEWKETLVRVLWYRVPDYPRDFKLWIKTKYQRAKRGWAVSDAWGLDYYLARVIKEGCIWLKENKHGIPTKCMKRGAELRKEKIKQYSDKRYFIEGERKWEDILFDIIWTFKVVEKINEGIWFYPHHKKYFTKKELKVYKKLAKEFKEEWPEDDYHVMTPEECEQYRKGWALFQEYFFSLWD